MKKILVAIIFSVSLLTLVTVASGVTGFFSKVSTKTLQVGDVVEQNFTIKKFYNLTVKFQKYNSTSDLTIRNSNTTIILKDENLTEVYRIVGMNGNSVASAVDKLQLDKVRYVSAYNLNNSANTYEDAENQAVNVSYVGLKTTIVIKTNQVATGDAIVFGFVFDELTNQAVNDVTIFANYVNANATAAQNSTTDGKYTLVLQTNSLGKSFDLFVRDYEIV